MSEVDSPHPRYEPRGWMQWPDNEEFSLEFMKLLGAAQEGGSTVSECFLAASRVDPTDEASWGREWAAVADINRERGNRAFMQGDTLTARSNWLRAANYYRAAGLYATADDPMSSINIARMQTCARQYLEQAMPAGEVVKIAWSDDHALQGYFLPAPGQPGRRPVVLCVGDPGDRKEEHLYKMARYARDRGLSLLLVDLFGAGVSLTLDDLVSRPELVTSISSCIDYLSNRWDIDDRRIAVLGDGAGTSFVTRGVAMDPRVACVVCDAGLWDLHQRTLATHWLTGDDQQKDIAADFAMASRHSAGKDITCPVLMTVGEQGWLDADHATRMARCFKENGMDVTLKIFRASETSASQGHADNPTLVNEFTFDWIADRLEEVAKAQQVLMAARPIYR